MFPAIGGILKAAESNWWEAGGATGAVRVYQPKGAASLEASYIDLTGNQNAAPGVAPTWDASSGWIFNGTTQFLTTGWTPDTDQSQTVLVQFSDAGVGNDYLLGSSNGSNRHFLIAPKHSGDVRYFNGGSVFVGTTLDDGILAIAGSQGYRNGVAEGGSIGGWAGSAVEIYIGGRNNGGSLADPIEAHIQAIAIYDNDIGASALAAVVAARAAL